MDNQTPTGNALEELRAKIAARTAGTDTPAPVVCINTRQPWAGKLKPPRKPRKPKVCTNSVQRLEEVMNQVKAGDLVGTMVIGRRKGGSFYLGIALPTGGETRADAGSYILAAEILKNTLLEINEYGLETTGEAYDLDIGDDL